MRARSALLLAALVALAGCLAPATEEAAPTGTGDGDAEGLVTELRALIDGLPCDVPLSAAGEVTAGMTENLRGVAADELASLGTEANHGELWIHGDLAFVARYSTGGVDIVDVSDPRAPRHLSFWDPEQTDRGLDVKTTADGLTAIVGGDRSIKLVNVQNPLEPVLEFEHVFGKAQAHMVTVFPVNGLEYVAAAKAEGSDLVIYRIDGTPGNRTLEAVSSPKLTLLGNPTGEGLLQTHDMSFLNDSLLGKPTLWLANVWDGIVALDVSDPANPVEISRIPSLDPYQGYTHTVQTVIRGDQRLTVSVAEVGVNGMKFYDTTDLANPRLLAFWSHPVAALPQHNLQLVGDYAYVAHYQQGLYVFNLSDLPQGPVPMRHGPMGHLPAADDGSQGSGPGSAFSGTWDVVVSKGLVYTSDIDKGLRVTAFGCLLPGDPQGTSTT
ncbi:MAG TPA: hypothetical protein VNZ52_09630 [Candidatus Thermoplasmatota archaeon]|nr:hypothetical protein [Candidatus Thermoplasmatota archaeon]